MTQTGNQNRAGKRLPPLQRHDQGGVFRHPQVAPEQPCAKPYLAQLFADCMAELNLSTEQLWHYGSMPDITLPPSEIGPELETEMRGMMVSMPCKGRWGVFREIRRTGVNAFTVVLDDEEIDLNDTARLHVTARAWREAGLGDVEQHCDGVDGQEIPGHLGEHPCPDTDEDDEPERTGRGSA